jgi:hypothetical protein
MIVQDKRVNSCDNPLRPFATPFVCSTDYTYVKDGRRVGFTIYNDGFRYVREHPSKVQLFHSWHEWVHGRDHHNGVYTSIPLELSLLLTEVLMDFYLANKGRKK